MPVKYFLRIAVLLFLAACEFQPSEIPEIEIKKPSEDGPAIQLELKPETNVLILFQNVKISYQFQTESNKIHWVEFYFDDELILRQQQNLSNMLEMNLDISNHTDGLYYLEILVFVASNTGSIADKVGAEGYLYQLKWPVLVDRTSPRKVKIESVEPVAGGALVKWNHYRFSPFENYKIRKVSFFDLKEEIIEIDNQDVTEYFDEDYLEGENVYYAIQVHGEWSQGVYFTQELDSLESRGFQNYSGEIVWRPTKNPNRLDYYRLYEGAHSNQRNEKKIPYEMGTTHAIDKLPFGSNKQFNLQFVPKTNNSNHSLSSLDVSSVVVSSGEKIPQFEVTKKVFGTDFSLYSNGNRIVLFDHQTKTKLDSIDFGSEKLRAYRLSMDGKLVYTLVENKLTAWEINGFVNQGSVDVSEIDESLSGIYEFNVSDNSKILFTPTNWKLLLYDFKNKEVILQSEENYGLGYLSPDGNFFLTQRTTYDRTDIKYFEIVDGKLELVHESIAPNTILRNFFFSTAENNEIITREGNNLFIRDANNFSEIKKIEISNSSIAIYDPETNYFIYEIEGGSQSGESHLILLPDEQVLDTVYLNSYNVVLHRNFIIGRNGRQMSINPK
jgi:hypothetical protein